QALARAREEVRRVAGDPAQFTPERMAGLDYLEACAHETMRLKPVAPLLAVQTVQGTTLADVELPAGTVVMGLMRHDSLQDSHFPDAAAFLPGRWLALLEIKMAAAALLSSFEIGSVGPSTGTDVPEHLAFSMGPRGLRMRLRERA